MSEASEIARRWRDVRARVDAACVRAKRDPAAVTIVAVSKTHPASAVRAAVLAGATDVGENYAQEMAGKQAELGDAVTVRWHYIGRLQRNKAKLVAGKVALVHAVDSLELAVELGKRTSTPPQRVLLAVNIAGEATKGGVAVDEVAALARGVAAVGGVELSGLMTMPPPGADPRPVFERLRTMRAQLQDELGTPLPALSMGMSGDFEDAIACGATHVRIGTAIFGSRG